MSFFKKHAAMVKPSLKLALHKEMAGWRPERTHKVLHASDLTKKEGFCPREFALLDLTGKKPKAQYIGTSLKATFDLGEALQKRFNEEWGRKFMVGTWKCVYCSQKHPFQKHPGKCTKCGCKALDYHEERFQCEASGTDCGIDALVDLGEPLLRIAEVKTIKADDFKTLLAPLAEHRWRTNLYLRVLAESSRPEAKRINTQEALVFYICKGFGNKDTSLAENGIKDAAFSPFKEYWVSRDDSVTEAAFQQARALKLFRDGVGGVPEGVCPTAYCKKASHCIVSKECWGSDFPAGAMIAKEGTE